MSRFIEKLKQASLSEPPPLGFRNVQKSAKPRLLIVASADSADASYITEITGSVDAILFNARKAAELKAVEKMAKSLKDIPCGCRVDGNINIDFEKTALDFIVFGDDFPAPALLKSEKTGRIVTADDTLAGEMIRILDAMPQDAVLLDVQSEAKLSLTWQKLTVYKRFSILSSKPLLASVPANLSSDELQAIWDMGVSGLVVKVSDEESSAALKELRQTVETLVTPSKRKHGKSRALVPRIHSEAPVVADDGDGEEDE